MGWGVKAMGLLGLRRLGSLAEIPWHVFFSECGLGVKVGTMVVCLYRSESARTKAKVVDVFFILFERRGRCGNG